jgi:hypothetical protein
MVDWTRNDYQPQLVIDDTGLCRFNVLLSCIKVNIQMYLFLLILILLHTLKYLTTMKLCQGQLHIISGAIFQLVWRSVFSESERVSNRCLTPTRQFSAISWREQVNFQWDCDGFSEIQVSWGITNQDILVLFFPLIVSMCSNTSFSTKYKYYK